MKQPTHAYLYEIRAVPYVGNLGPTLPVEHVWTSSHSNEVRYAATYTEEETFL